MKIPKKHIVLFDGSCNLCNFWVKFIIKRDKKDLFRFASLQSEIGATCLEKYKVDTTMDTVVFIENNRIYVKSNAALRILKKLGGGYAVFYYLRIIPTFIRDYCYDIIAKFRYRWFGKQSCEFVPPQNIEHKFLM